MPGPLISVVLPVYNVEPFLRQCLDSVLAQSLADIEVIPVDDGSPDRCGEIIDEYAARDARVRPVHQANGGYGKAINSGLELATGEYIAIVETDDWVDPDMLYTLYTAARTSGRDIVKAEFTKILDDGRLQDCPLAHLTGGVDGPLSPAASLELMIYESSIWTALYRRAFLQENAIRMLETQGAAYQDVVWKFMTYSLVPDIYLVNRSVYNYRVFAPGSSSTNPERALAMFRNYAVIRTFLEEHGRFDSFKQSFYVHQIFDCVFHANRLAGEPRALFYSNARTMIEQALEDGVDFEKIGFGDGVGEYVSAEVLPLYRAIRHNRFYRLHLRRRLKKALKAYTAPLRKLLFSTG